MRSCVCDFGKVVCGAFLRAVSVDHVVVWFGLVRFSLVRLLRACRPSQTVYSVALNLRVKYAACAFSVGGGGCSLALSMRTLHACFLFFLYMAMASWCLRVSAFSFVLDCMLFMLFCVCWICFCRVECAWSRVLIVVRGLVMLIMCVSVPVGCSGCLWLCCSCLSVFLRVRSCFWSLCIFLVCLVSFGFVWLVGETVRAASISALVHTSGVGLLVVCVRIISRKALFICECFVGGILMGGVIHFPRCCFCNSSSGMFVFGLALLWGGFSCGRVGGGR